MIKTQHVRLNAAADRLGVDTDTILISAAEGGVQLYALLNDWRYVSPNLVPDEEPKSDDVVFRGAELFEHVSLPFPVKKYFKFIRIGSYDASSILKSGEAIWQGGICTEPDEKGVFWETAVPGPDLLEMMRESDPNRFKLRKIKGGGDDDKNRRCPVDEFESYEPAPLFLRKDDLFLKSSDLEKVMSGKSAASLMSDKEPVPRSPQKVGGETKVENSHNAVIAGLLHALSKIKNRKITIKEVVNYSEQSGWDVKETTVGKILRNCQRGKDIRVN